MCCVVQVVAHSVGTWNAYEFLMLARSRGLPMPKHLFVSAMAAPDIPQERRPWRQNSTLDEEAFKVPPSSLRQTTLVRVYKVSSVCLESSD